MARNVMYAVTVTNSDGYEKWEFVLRKDYLSSFNASFLILLNEKKNDQIIHFLYLSKIVIDFITEKKIDTGVENFYEFLFKFNSTLSYYEKKFPKKAKTIKSKVDSYSVDINYKIESNDNIMECDYDIMKISCPFILECSYPLIPEFLEICKERLYVRKKDEDEKQYVCRLKAFLLYLNEYYDRYPDDSILELIENTRIRIEKNYNCDPEFAHYVESAMDFKIVKNDYIATNLELFIEYLFLDILSRKDKEMFDRIVKLLSVKNLIDSEKFYRLIIDKIAETIRNKGLSDLYACFMKLRNKHSNRYIFELFNVKYPLFLNSNEYSESFFQKDGDAR